MISIDQNCHTLWDVAPKLQALSHRGYKVTHYLEDIDVAFTSIRGHQDDPLRLVRERYYHSGLSDWGAALFYSEFLGRLPVDIRRFEPLTGLKTSTLARQLETSVDALYDEFSPSDNWQLVGSSFVGQMDHHRVIGDLTLTETQPFLLEMMEKARADFLRTFPEKKSQKRITAWLETEQGLLNQWLRECEGKSLIELYRCWMDHALRGCASLALTCSLFACRPDNSVLDFLNIFTTHYETASRSYNEAIRESGLGLHPLNRRAGELPFFASFEYQGRQVRSSVNISDSKLVIGAREFDLLSDHGIPFEKLQQAGVRCLAGKAVALVLQVRHGPAGQSLALPYRGSLYTPAAHILEDKLRRAGLLTGRLKPLMRVRFHLLDRMKDTDTVIRLPRHLVGYFGVEELPAKTFSEMYPQIIEQADSRLQRMKDSQGRSAWQKETFPELFREIASLGQKQKELARQKASFEQTGQIWNRIKELKKQVIRKTLEQVAADSHVQDMDYWDSRGALLPWCIALGGQEFYRHVIEQADIYEELS